MHGAVVKQSHAAIVKHMVSENWTFKIHSNLNISFFIHGAVVKKSHVAIAKHMVLETPPSKAHHKTTLQDT